MALKKDNQSVDNEDQKFPKDELSTVDSTNLEKEIGIQSKSLELSEENNTENGFLDFGFSQSLLTSLKNKGYRNIYVM